MSPLDQREAEADGAYDLSALGWLLFERLCAGWLERAVGVEPDWWLGSADRHRYVVLEGGLPAAPGADELPGPTIVVCVFSHGERPGSRAAVDPAAEASWRALVASWQEADASRGAEPSARSLLVLTDQPAADMRAQLDGVAGFTDVLDDLLPVHILGSVAMGEAIDEDLRLRLAHPFVLGVRREGPVLPEPDQIASRFDLDAARALARVFVPSGPYGRALAVLQAHNFCVLTGPPEMGKTAAARMIGLVLLSDGWEVHECTKPDEVAERLRPDRRQLFVADDAFGSTEYRPDAAERWARALPEILRATDENHWLVWTSRPTPLKAGLRAIHRERGGERFPAPAEVHVDAADLEVAEKALILFRHAKAAGLDARALQIVRLEGARIVAHDHFTPERIRRFVRSRLPRLAQGFAPSWKIERAVNREIEYPTEAMAASYLALGDCQRAVLVAMLDCPAGTVSERDLAAAARRHAPAGLDRAPFDLVDRLADHFLRIAAPRGVSWVHPSWRDLVIAQLAGDPAARRCFLTSCGHHGALLALSSAGGATGGRRLPLLIDDADWDALRDNFPELVRNADERSLTELIGALRTALEAAADDPRGRGELASLAALALQIASRTRPVHQPVGVNLVESWLRLDGSPPPWLSATWLELLPSAPPEPDSPPQLARYEDWLVLAQTLQELCPKELVRLDFPGDQARIASELSHAARPFLADPHQWRTATRLGPILLRAADLFGQSVVDTAPVDSGRRVGEILEAKRIRERHALAVSDEQAFVDRVLVDLDPDRQRGLLEMPDG